MGNVRDAVNEIINDELVNELYENRGDHVVKEAHDHYKFKLYNYEGMGLRFWADTIEYIVEQIEDQGIVVFDYYQQNDREAVIETEAD